MMMFQKILTSISTVTNQGAPANFKFVLKFLFVLRNETEPHAERIEEAPRVANKNSL